jgi:hypothetical protein
VLTIDNALTSLTAFVNPPISKGFINVAPKASPPPIAAPAQKTPGGG